jgi:transcriptional regulator with XRE-family HTH domain
MSEAARLLRHARRRAGLSQCGLATRARVPQPYVARIESSRTDPTVSSLSRLLRACETTLEAMPGSGEGIDRTTFTHRLPPAERLARAVAAARGVAALHGSPTVVSDVTICPDADTASGTVSGHVVDVVALDDLIRMKRAAGRPKDRIEVEVLLALRDAITEAT